LKLSQTKTRRLADAYPGLLVPHINPPTLVGGC